MSAIRTMPKIRNRDMGFLAQVAFDGGASKSLVRRLGSMTQAQFDEWEPRLKEIVRNGGTKLKPRLDGWEREFADAFQMCVLRATKAAN